MVILKIEITHMHGMENTVIINCDVKELKPFSEITITKSNGTRFQFRLIMDSSVSMERMLIGRAESRKYRLHSGHIYRVEGVESSAMVQTKSIVDFSRMNIAGYSSVITYIVRSVFVPRKLSAELSDQLGSQLVRGVILHGPPGTGKTTIVKALCNYFNLEPRIIDCPELLDSLVGKSEKAVRELFVPAQEDQKLKGDSSPLHVFVFEEMDCLFSKRRSNDGGAHTRHGIVSQLLSMMDGYEQLNNILIFGTTNRIDMIDPALLRGGRFEISLLIGLPNPQDRWEIINFHLRKPRDSGRLAADISAANLEMLANATEGFSGADLAQIIRFAISQLTNRPFTEPMVDLEKFSSKEKINAVLKWDDLRSGFHMLQQQRRVRENRLKSKEDNTTK